MTDPERDELCAAIEDVQLAWQRCEVEYRARDLAIKRLGELLSVPDYEERVVVHDSRIYTVTRRGDLYRCTTTPVDLTLPF